MSKSHRLKTEDLELLSELLASMNQIKGVMSLRLTQIVQEQFKYDVKELEDLVFSVDWENGKLIIIKNTQERPSKV